MALDALLDGIDVPLWLGGVLMVALNGVLLAHVSGWPLGSTVADAVLWSVALAVAVVLLRSIAFRRARWRTVGEWTGVTLVVADLVGAAVVHLAG